MIQIKRIYEQYSKTDGYRILVDRLWARGISKEKAHLDQWMKDIGPSSELRKWFGHKVERWHAFEKKYKEELREKRDLLEQIKTLEKKHHTITLLYGAKDTEHNQAVAILDLLKKK